MSPGVEITTIEMSPNLEVSTGGQTGKDRNEQQGITTSRSPSASGKRRAETCQCRGDDGGELSAEQALGPALSRRRSARTETRKCGARVEPKEAEEISRAGVAVGGQEVLGGRRRAVRTDVSGGALGE